MFSLSTNVDALNQQVEPFHIDHRHFSPFHFFLVSFQLPASTMHDRRRMYENEEESVQAQTMFSGKNKLFPYIKHVFTRSSQDFNTFDETVLEREVW